MKKLLEELRKVDGNSTEFQRGFNTAINIIIALDNADTKRINDLEQEIAKLQLRIAALEACKEPYPYVTYCDTGYYTTGTISPTITSSKDANVTK